MTVHLQSTSEAVERLLRRGVAQVEIDFIVPVQDGAILKVGKLQYIRIIVKL